jgi:hypothetical protein
MELWMMIRKRTDAIHGSSSKCSQLAISQKKATPILDFLAEEDWHGSRFSQSQEIFGNSGQPDFAGLGPMPKIQVVDGIDRFHRVCTIEPLERIQDVSEAWERLKADVTDAAANRCVGLHLLQNMQNGIPLDPGKDPVSYLRAAALSGGKPPFLSKKD